MVDWFRLQPKLSSFPISLPYRGEKPQFFMPGLLSCGTGGSPSPIFLCNIWAKTPARQGQSPRNGGIFQGSGLTAEVISLTIPGSKKTIRGQENFMVSQGFLLTNVRVFLIRLV
jgi:hypothetical protein